MNITQQESISMTETKLSGGLKGGGILKKNTWLLNLLLIKIQLLL